MACGTELGGLSLGDGGGGLESFIYRYIKHKHIINICMQYRQDTWSYYVAPLAQLNSWSANDL